MTELTVEFIADILGPYRRKIDQLDQDIMALLNERQDVVKRVADLKNKHGIPSRLEDRIEEVVHNAVKLARQHHLSEDIIERFYRELIEYNCNLEDNIMGHVPEVEQKKSSA